ncbi:MAG: helix-turn-helix domain-containing protein [Lachnospiraceae bacterium]|nr:helix-turn-helix domain-containing protein [Lachnospiraceae bacterium]
MEIRAYSELYIESAQNVVGHMFDFAVNEIGLQAEGFANLFAASELSKQVEKGNPKYVVGISGPELAKKVLEKASIKYKKTKDVMYEDKSPEYWAGWALTYYQWYRNYPFRYILKAVPFEKLLRMYNIYHEMDIMKLIESMDKMVAECYSDTALKRFRELIGISQKELAERAGVPLRQIQLFEQRQRDITKAQAATVLKLSKALFCGMEELLR